MTYTLLEGNNLELLPTLPDCSVDAIVTDPPYELGFMGKSWDASGIAYNTELWRECLRVLKHGGHMLAFSGSRTYHRMVVAIEDAGFEIRDQIMWVYGSGFPKSLDVSKAIQKASGVQPIGFKENKDGGFYGTGAGWNATPRQLFMPEPEGEAQQWSGWGTALKPAHEPIVLARKPLIGTVAANVLQHGTGALNIDACRIGEGTGESKTVSYPDIRGNNYNNAEGTVEYTVTDKGRFPANFIHDGSEEVLALFPETKSQQSMRGVNRGGGVYDLGFKNREDYVRGNNDSGSAARFFYCAKASKAERNTGLQHMEKKPAGSYEGRSDGSLGKVTEPAQNFHPTVKPLALMRYLIRLITPPNGTVLDPFAGSGTTLVAAIQEGFHCVGIELTADYYPIIHARCEHAQTPPDQPTLFT
jgi:site-specific DNA-methyltransferase (adenine-specific)